MKRITKVAIVAALAASMLGCKEPASGKSPAPGPSGPPAPAEPTTPIGGGAVTTEDPAAVQALLASWLEAQNKQDFAAYEALYASRFTGVRRSGTREVNLDRKGWVADRRRMFKKRMKVEISDVQIEPFAIGAIARFTQRWASGEYEDIGPKQLVVVRENQELRIAREEMLESRLLDDATKPTELASAEFAFVIDAGGPYVVIERSSVQPSKLELVSQDDPVVVKGTLSENQLSPEAASWKGQKVRSGECVATVVDFAVVSRVYPHFGERQTWAGEFTGDEDERPYTEQQIAESVFTSTDALLAGRLEPEAGCQIGGYVRKDSRPAPTTAETFTDPLLAQAALSAFRALPAYKEIQDAFRDSEEGQGGGFWDEYDPDDRKTEANVTLYKHAPTGIILIAVQAYAPGTGCGSFNGEHSALFKLEGSLKKPTLELLGEPSFFHIYEVLDLDADGRLELLISARLHETKLITPDGQELRSLSVPDRDCPC